MEEKSILIEMNKDKLLLDSGITDAFLKNAKTYGLKYLNSKKTLILHLECYIERYSLRRNMAYAGINETRGELKNKFELIETKDPCKIYNNIWFLGQVDRKFEVPVKNLLTVLKNEEIDYLKYVPRNYIIMLD